MTILLGDSLDDSKMTDKSDNVLKILIRNPRPDEKMFASEFNENYQKSFDLIIRGQGFKPMVKLLNIICGQ